MVRANFNDYQDKIYATQKYLNCFFGNLLLGETIEQKDRNLRIDVGGMSEKTPEIVGEMSEREKRILALMAENNIISAKQLAERLNTTDRTIEREIKK